MKSKDTSLDTRHSTLDTVRGFTLLEVLVAVAITAVVIAALYSTFFLSQRAADAVDDSLLKLQECRSVLDTLKRELESALYNPEKTHTVFKLEDRDFYGKQASQLLFTSFTPLPPGLSRISYTVEENEGSLVLKKKMETAYGESSGTKDFELMKGLESFTIEAGYNGKWIKTWDSDMSKKMPGEIRVTLKVAAKEESSHLAVMEIARPRIGKAL